MVKYKVSCKRNFLLYTLRETFFSLITVLLGWWQCKRSLPPAFCWERGHLDRHFSGRDARAPKGE